MNLLYFILEDQTSEGWEEFLRLAAKPGTIRSLLAWAAEWFGHRHCHQWRLRRVSCCEPHGWWDGEQMTHRPLCCESREG